MINYKEILKRIEAADQYLVHEEKYDTAQNCIRLKTNKGITVTAYETGTVLCQGPGGPALTALRDKLGLLSPNDREPDPKPTDERPVWDTVIEDMKERNQRGIATYGTPLQPSNGRNALVDAYQESLDQSVYLKQAIEQRALMVKEIQAIAEQFCPGSEDEAYEALGWLRAWVEKWQ